MCDLRPGHFSGAQLQLYHRPCSSGRLAQRLGQFFQALPVTPQAALQASDVLPAMAILVLIGLLPQQYLAVTWAGRAMRKLDQLGTQSQCDERQRWWLRHGLILGVSVAVWR